VDCGAQEWFCARLAINVVRFWNAELLECCRPLCSRDGNGLDVELHDFTHSRSELIRAHH
jgi:hypothetical protein